MILQFLICLIIIYMLWWVCIKMVQYPCSCGDVPNTKQGIKKEKFHSSKSKLLEKKDSLDKDLEDLTRRLAAYESRMRLSRSRIKLTEKEIEEAAEDDMSLQRKYMIVLDKLKSELKNNEEECRSIQVQIECLSTKRADLKEDVSRGRKMYADAVTTIAQEFQQVQRCRQPREKPENVRCCGSTVR